MSVTRKLPPYRQSLAGRLLDAREVVMTPLRPVLREAGITEQQWRVLRVLMDQGGIDLATVASNALLRPPSVTRILRELQQRGLITRAADPDDGRRSIVDVSRIGRALVEKTAVVSLSILDRYAEAFGVARLERLIAELALLIETIAVPHRLIADAGRADRNRASERMSVPSDRADA